MKIGRTAKVRGVEVDADLIKEVHSDDYMTELEKKTGTEGISPLSFLAIFMMFIPAMIGVMVTALASMWLSLMQLFGNYTILDLLAYQVMFYISAPMGIMTSVLVYALVRMWAQSSFEGLSVIRLVGRNASASKTICIDYFCEEPKAMKKPTTEQLGKHLGAYLREQVYQLHFGIPVEEIQGNLERMTHRLALAQRKQMEKMEAQRMKTVSRTVRMVVQDPETGIDVIDPETGQPMIEELEVQVPVFKPKVGLRRRLVIALFSIVTLVISLWGLQLISLMAFNFDLFNLIFGWLPWM